MANADSLRQRLRAGANAMMRAAVEDELMGQLLEVAPSGEGMDRRFTGEPILVQTGYAHQIQDGDRISWVIGFTAPQGEWIEFGTDDHPIYPHDPNGVLHWIDQFTGEDVFAKYVLHNSIEPRPWFFPTIRQAWPGVLEENLDLLSVAA